MAQDSEQLVLLNRLADEFAERYRSGERPSLSEYINRHPQLADDIREFFPALVEMERVKEERQQVSEPPALGPLPPLERLGDFRIVREIGHGGMGVVYEAEQVSLGRHVALKVLPKQLLVEERAKRRFEREAKAAAKLHHTNIVPVFGVGEHDGLPYYVMQFIPGLGLDEVLEELKRLKLGEPGGIPGRFDMRTGGELRVSRKDISAVVVAQSLLTGWPPLAEEPEDRAADRFEATAVHTPSAPSSVRGRGLETSPSADAPRTLNETPVAGRLSDTFALSSSSVVMPGTGPQAGKKLLTYWQSVAQIGLQVADALEYAHRQGIQHRDIKPSNLLLDTTGTVWVTDFGLAKAEDQENLTRTGDVLGTLRYMPPEAFDGKADARSDVYGLGLTLYELLAFRPAFNEKERNRLIKQVTTEEPARLERLNPDAPRDLVTIVHKAIERELDHRYPTAGALEADLKRFLDDEPIHARRQTQLERYVRWARHNPLIAALGGVLTAVLLLATVASLLAAGYFNRLRWNEAQAAQKERAARYDADHSRAASEESRAAAELETYHALLSEVRALRSGHETGWREKALSDLARLAVMPVPRRDLAELRTEAVATLGTPDICLAARIPLPSNVAGSVTFSPDGQTLLTADPNSGIAFWDVPGNRLLSVVTDLAIGQDANRFAKAVYLPAGQGLAVATRDRGVVFTDSQGNLTSRAAIKQGSSKPIALAISGPLPSSPAAGGEGKVSAVIAIAWSNGGGTTFHDAVTGTLMDRFKYSSPTFALSPDGKWLTREETGEIVLLPILSGSPRIVLGRHAGTYALAFSPNGGLLAAAFADHTTVLWDVAKREQLATLRGHREKVFDMAFSPDGEWLATGSLDYTTRIWDTRTGQNVATLPGFSSPSFKVRWSPTGEYLAATLNNSREVLLYKITGRHHVQQWLIGHGVELRCVAAHPRLDRLATSGYTELSTWDLSAARPSSLVMAPNPGAVTSLTYSPDGSLLAVGSGQIVVRDATTGKVQGQGMSGPTPWINALAFDPAGGRLASGDLAGNVILWDLATNLPVENQKFLTGSSVNSIVFLDSEKVSGTLTRNRLLTHSKDALLLYNFESKEPERKVSLGGGIRMFVADRQRSRLVVGFDNGAIGSVSLPDLTPGPRVEHAHDGSVACLALSPDGRLLATASDHRVVLRDATTFETLLRFPLWDGTLRDVNFDRTGRRLAFVGTGNDVDLWDLDALRDGLTEIGLGWDPIIPPKAANAIEAKNDAPKN